MPENNCRTDLIEAESFVKLTEDLSHCNLCNSSLQHGARSPNVTVGSGGSCDRNGKGQTGLHGAGP